jgi:hypothetical protein
VRDLSRSCLSSPLNPFVDVDVGDMFGNKSNITKEFQREDNQAKTTRFNTRGKCGTTASLRSWKR